MSDIQEEQKRLYKRAEENDLKEIWKIDGNKENNCVENLEWCSYSHNNMEARKLGLNKGWKGMTYKKRCQLAIEYIGQHFIEEGSCEINKITGEYTCEGNENFLEELLDILQGSDRE